MATRTVATVFGGAGFIGRYVVKRLAAKGFVVRVCGRSPERVLPLKTSGALGQIVPLYTSFAEEATIARAVEGADVVVNLVGILAEQRPGDFFRIQGDAPGRIAALAAAQGVTRMVHVSAIGADPAGASLYAQSKAKGEAAVRAALPTASILRPSTLFGAEDNFFNQFARIAQLSPIMPVISGDTRFQPVYVADVADAVMAGLTRADTAGKLFELGGPRVLTFRDILAYILDVTRRRRFMVEVPPAIVRLQARILERLPGKLLTTDQLLLLSHDNVVAPGALGLADLGIVATPLEMIVPGYLRRYRQGGNKREIMPEELKVPTSDLTN